MPQLCSIAQLSELTETSANEHTDAIRHLQREMTAVRADQLRQGVLVQQLQNVVKSRDVSSSKSAFSLFLHEIPHFVECISLL